MACNRLRSETLPAIGNLVHNMGPTPGDKVKAAVKFALACGTVNLGVHFLPIPNLFAGVTWLGTAAGFTMLMSESPSPIALCQQCRGEADDAPPMIDNWGRYYGKVHLLAVGNGIVAGLVSATVVQLVRRYKAGELFQGIRQGMKTVNQGIRLTSSTAGMIWLIKTQAAHRHCPPASGPSENLPDRNPEPLPLEE